MSDPEGGEALREALIRAVAGLDGYEHPNTEPGGWWDKRIEPVYRAALRSPAPQPDPKETHDQLSPGPHVKGNCRFCDERGVSRVQPEAALDVESVARALDDFDLPGLELPEIQSAGSISRAKALRFLARLGSSSASQGKT